MTAAHSSGLCVQFTAAPDTSGTYVGEVVEGIPDLPTEREALQQTAQRLARLMREAGQIFSEQYPPGFD